MIIGSGFYVRRVEKVGENSYRVLYGSVLKSEPPKGGGRGDIAGMSERSAVRVAFAATVLSPKLKSMITFTLPARGDIRIMKSALNAYLTARRTYCARRGIDYKYVWFLEFTLRGWPHIHLLTSDTVNPENEKEWRRRVLSFYRLYWKRVKRPSEKLVRKSAWFNSARRNADLPEAARVAQKLRTTDGAARYAAKYAAKSSRAKNELNYQKNTRGRWAGRMWGGSRLPEPDVLFSVGAAAARRDLRQVQFAGQTVIDCIKSIKPHLAEYGNLPELIF